MKNLTKASKFLASSGKNFLSKLLLLLSFCASVQSHTFILRDYLSELRRLSARARSDFLLCYLTGFHFVK